MKVVMLPELTCQTGRFVSFVTCSVSTYKSGNIVQTNGATSVATLAGKMNWFGIACIGITILQAVIYQYRFEGVEECRDASWLFDVTTFIFLALLFVGLNVAVSLSASR